MSFEGHPGVVYGVAFSPDGRKVLSGGASGSAILWDRESGAIVRRLSKGSNTVFSVAFSPDGSRVLLPNLDRSGSIHLIECDTGKKVREYDENSSGPAEDLRQHAFTALKSPCEDSVHEVVF